MTLSSATCPYRATYIYYRACSKRQFLIQTHSSLQHRNYGSTFDCEQSSSGPNCNKPHPYDSTITKDPHFSRSRHRVKTPEFQLGEGEGWNRKLNWPSSPTHIPNQAFAESGIRPIPPLKIRTRCAEHQSPNAKTRDADGAFQEAGDDPEIE